MIAVRKAAIGKPGRPTHRHVGVDAHDAQLEVHSIIGIAATTLGYCRTRPTELKTMTLISWKRSAWVAGLATHIS